MRKSIASLAPIRRISRLSRRILRHGVELRISTPVGSIEDLKAQGFKAVFLATGAQKGRPLGVEGDTVEGVQDGLAVLRARGLGQTPSLGKRVVVCVRAPAASATGVRDELLLIGKP